VKSPFESIVNGVIFDARFMHAACTLRMHVFGVAAEG
jgi:hypothetical protein